MRWWLLGFAFAAVVALAVATASVRAHNRTLRLALARLDAESWALRVELGRLRVEAWQRETPERLAERLYRAMATRDNDMVEE